jgi:hypothetical protein
MSEKKILIGFLLLLLCFILPLHIYIIGDNLGAGIQGAFFRFQVTGFGDSFGYLNQDLGYIITGIYTGKTALSILAWTIADVFLLLGTAVCFIEPDERTVHIVNKNGLFIIAGGIMIFVSCIVQYGYFLHGAAGTSIPVGVPLMIISGWFIQYHSDWDAINDGSPDKNVISASNMYINLNNKKI